VQKASIFGQMLLCFLTHLGVSVMLFKSLKHQPFSKVSWPFQLMRFTFAIFYHFEFVPEVQQALMCLKYTVYHSDKFEWPVMAAMSCILQFSICLVVEVVGVLNV
jgi:hypothetical protein